MNGLESHFLLNPEVAFLNHGSFGATPKPVFEVYQEWQRRLEFQPVDFVSRQLQDALTESRQRLATYLNCGGNDLYYVPNATFGVNIIARSLDLGPNDDVLTSDHEYGACMNSFRFMSKKMGFKIIEQPLELPFQNDEAVADVIWAGVTPQTKLIYLSHITSATAQRLPIEIICRRAREAGILTLIDGAHATSQIPLDLTALDADFYTGNCHKWLSSPKGAAFFYAHPRSQDLVEPLVVGWGYGEKPHTDYGTPFLNTGSYLGTNDYAAYLSVPAAIDFQADHNWEEVKHGCRALLKDGLSRLEEILDVPSMYPDIENDVPGLQLGIVELPPGVVQPELKSRLIDEFQVEIPVTAHRDKLYIRISVQGYNTENDIDRLESAVKTIFNRTG